MNITVLSGDALRQTTPLLVAGAWENEPLRHEIANLVEEADWNGKFKETLLIYPRGALSAQRLLLLGLGRRDQFTVDRLRELAAIATQHGVKLKVERLVFELPTTERIPAATRAQAAVEGSLLGSYRFTEYKTDLGPEDHHRISELTIVTDQQDDSIKQGIAVGEIISRGVILARNLVNRPGNVVAPATLAEEAQAIGARSGLHVTVFGPDELKQQGFGGLLGVGQGSQQAPRFIILEHGAELANTPTICLVGKGITFDTGGISIKSAEQMDYMKMDMGGAAAVLGAMAVIAELKLPLHVVGLVSAAENMPSGTAYRPGDILKTLSGKTIEVINTDAEGRIVLADALFYAQRYNPDAIIDLATLTGAIGVALGPHATGLVSNNDALADRILRASEVSGEAAWRLPLWEPYKEMVKSDIADVKNSAGRGGGAITAAAFLSNFVGDYPWVHLDIASTAWVEPSNRTPKAYTPKGSTGVGVRLLVEALRSWAST